MPLSCTGISAPLTKKTTTQVRDDGGSDSFDSSGGSDDGTGGDYDQTGGSDDAGFGDGEVQVARWCIDRR